MKCRLNEMVNLVSSLRGKACKLQNSNTFNQTRRLAILGGIREETHLSIKSNDQNPFTEIAKKLCNTIRIRPRWEKTLLSDFPSLNFSDPNFIREILKHQNNAFLSFRFFHFLCSLDCFSPNSQTSNYIFDTLIKAKAWKPAMSVMCSMKSQTEPTFLESYIKCLCQDGEMEEVLNSLPELKRLGFSLSLSIWNELFMGCIRIGRTDLLWVFYGEMIESGVVGNVTTAGYLIRAFCKEKKLSEAYVLLMEVLQNGNVPDVVSFTKLISGFSNEGNYSRVSELLHLMIAKNCLPDVFTYQGIIYGLFENGMGFEGFRVFNDLKGRGYVIDVVMYTTMIDGLCKMGRIENARKLWHEMIQNGLIPNEYTYNVLVDGYCKMRDMVEAQKLYKEMCDRGYRESTVSCNTMIAGLCLLGRMDEACHVFEEMAEKGIDRDTITYTTLIQGFCTSGKTLEGLSIYHKLLGMGLQPLTSSYTPLIQALCKEGNVQKAIILLNDMLNRGLEPLVCTHDYIITGFCEQGNSTEGIDWLTKMLRSKLKPRDETFNKLIECLSLEDRVDDAMLVLDAMLGMGYTLGEYVCSLLVSRLCRDNIYQIEDCLETILQTN
ncbi:tetratricopeptide repeat (TPR)-like superfamily protein [Tasmannia lanceolata]|uniref:tetratricopeptide repeat (TPR)-like superfamily protein n=1 Tax=Tasmannia lanceolata TaxID=3420 RepID=UPI00406445C1